MISSSVQFGSTKDPVTQLLIDLNSKLSDYISKMVAMDIDISVLQVTMACTLVLYFKFFGTTLIQGGKRFAAGSRPPEDRVSVWAKYYKAKQTYGMEVTTNLKHAEADIRWQRIVLNDVGMFSSYSYVISNVMQQNLIIPRLVIIMNVCLSVCLHLQRAFQWVYCLHGDQCFVHTVHSFTWPALLLSPFPESFTRIPMRGVPCSRSGDMLGPHPYSNHCSGCEWSLGCIHHVMLAAVCSRGSTA